MINCPDSLIIISGQVVYCPSFISCDDAHQLFAGLRQELHWRQESLWLFGRQQPVPRQVAWYGDAGLVYRYSGVDHVASGWPSSLQALRQRLSELTGVAFNGVLCNLYRSGQDSMGWHSDNETELGTRPVIASISLGQGRDFLLRRRKDHNVRHGICLEHGSLLLMYGDSQADWQHCLPRRRRQNDERINLTFRYLIHR